MGLFSKKSFDQIRQDFALLLVNYGHLDSVYDLVISIVERKERDHKTGEYFIVYEAHASKLDEYDEVSCTEIDPPQDVESIQLIDWNIGRGLTVKHAMQNLYCNVKEILEPDDEIEDCYG
jgi:hypothetical protein